jgi:Undecaprenyl-phosphate glucose phosphotransferase
VELGQEQAWSNSNSSFAYLIGAEAHQRSAKPSPGARAFHLRPDYKQIASDLMLVWDVLAIPATGFLSLALLWSATQASVLSLHPLVERGSPPLLAALLTPLVLYERTREPEAWHSRVGATTLRCVGLFGLMVGITMLTGKAEAISLKWLSLWLVSAVAATLAGRLLLRIHISGLTKKGILRERAAVVGSGPLAGRLVADLQRRSRGSIDIAGVFHDDPAAFGDSGVERAGTIRDLVELGRRWTLDSIYVVDAGDCEASLERLLNLLMSLDAEIFACALPLAAAGHQQHDAGQSFHRVRLVGRPIVGWGMLLKAIQDKVLGLILLITALPIMLFIAFLIRRESPGPVIFRQKRHGWNNSEFEVLKFRTMRWRGEEHASGARQTSRGDPRVTRIGRFLRKTSLDELPQLINVMRGEMSLVGPRPHPVAMRTAGRLNSEIVPGYACRHRVKPGLTGLAQINGCRGATEQPYQLWKRVEYDLAYINGWSLLLDLKILVLTPARLVFCRDNAF